MQIYVDIFSVDRALMDMTSLVPVQMEDRRRSLDESKAWYGTLKMQTAQRWDKALPEMMDIEVFCEFGKRSYVKV